MFYNFTVVKKQKEEFDLLTARMKMLRTLRDIGGSRQVPSVYHSDGMDVIFNTFKSVSAPN